MLNFNKTRIETIRSHNTNWNFTKSVTRKRKLSATHGGFSTEQSFYDY